MKRHERSAGELEKCANLVAWVQSNGAQVHWKEFFIQVSIERGLPRTLEAGQRRGRFNCLEREIEDLLSGRIRANNFVTLDDRGNADPRGAILRLSIDANHFAHRANENL